MIHSEAKPSTIKLKNSNNNGRGLTNLAHNYLKGLRSRVQKSRINIDCSKLAQKSLHVSDQSTPQASEGSIISNFEDKKKELIEVLQRLFRPGNSASQNTKEELNTTANSMAIEDSLFSHLGKEPDTASNESSNFKIEEACTYQNLAKSAINLSIIIIINPNSDNENNSPTLYQSSTLHARSIDIMEPSITKKVKDNDGKPIITEHIQEVEDEEEKRCL